MFEAVIGLFILIQKYTMSNVPLFVLCRLPEKLILLLSLQVGKRLEKINKEYHTVDKVGLTTD